MKTIKFYIVLLALLSSAALVQAHPAVQDTLGAIKYLKHTDYKVLKSRAIVIYERQRPGDKLNLFKPIITHYFSVKGSDKLYPLTLENLKKVYPDGPAFKTVDTYFDKDDDLLAYDKIHHQFRINYYLSMTDAGTQQTSN